MKTVKEVSKLTGISVRTLHYYDEIGLLKPSSKSESGYRLYDDQALETLQQILFFREFDISLKEIKSVMENPTLDKHQILQMQRDMLTIKKERLERLIVSIDRILKGEDHMNFEVFDKSELEELYNSMISKMSEEQKSVFIEHYGSMENFQKHFMESTSGETAQKNFQKVVEWYGDKESAKKTGMNPDNPQIFSAYQKRLEAVMQKLAAKKDCDVHSFEVKELVGEYDFVSRQLYQMRDVSKMSLELAQLYLSDSNMQKAQDSVYGEGVTEFFGKAIQAFYQPTS